MIKGWPEEGDPCAHADCTGTVGFVYDGDCTCFLCAPCSRCENSRLECTVCGWPDDESELFTGIVTAGKTCDYCAQAYSAHPPSMGAPWLFRLCDGSLGRP